MLVKNGINLLVEFVVMAMNNTLSETMRVVIPIPFLASFNLHLLQLLIVIYDGIGTTQENDNNGSGIGVLMMMCILYIGCDDELFIVQWVRYDRDKNNTQYTTNIKSPSSPSLCLPVLSDWVTVCFVP